MIDLRQRSCLKELLDEDDIPFEDIKLNMQELNTINTLLGGHAITLKGMELLIPPAKKEIIICEIGCGGGDNLMTVLKWCKKQQIKAHFIGIDIKKECIEFCKQRFSTSEVEWICSDYNKAIFKTKPDIIFSSLFCHHFSDTDLVKMLQWMKQQSFAGFFINDLHRHPLAFYSIKMLTSIFSKSYLVKNDAPLSVARGFTKPEWKTIFQRAGISCNIQWKWAFRHLITYKHD